MSDRLVIWVPAAILAVALSVGGVVWLGLVGDVAAELTNGDNDGPEFGRDFAAFQLAGKRVASGDARELYVFDDETVSRGEGPSRFVNPPFYALGMVPFSPTDQLLGYLIWTVLGAGALAIGLKLLGVRHGSVWFVGILLTTAGVLNTFYGQNSLFTFLILSAAYASLKARRELRGGALIGLVAYKPQLLGGFAVWLAYRRKWKVIGGAAFSLALLVAVSLLLIPEAWPPFLDTIISSDGDLAVAESQLTLRHALLLLLPGQARAALALYVVALAGAIVGQAWFLRRICGDMPLEFASAVAVSILIAPRGLTYDWLLLAIPVILAWKRRPERQSLWMWLTSLLVASVFVSVYAAKWQLSEFGRAVQVAPGVLAVVLVVAARALVRDVNCDAPALPSASTIRGDSGAVAP